MNANTARSPGARLVKLGIPVLLALPISVALAQNESSVGSRREKAVYAVIERVPAKARAQQNPLENDPDAAVAGGKLFEQHCAECHGMKAGGTRRGPSLLKEQVQQATPGALFWILTNGVVRQGMPTWSKLPEPERWQIVTFLKSFRVPEVSRDQPLGWANPRRVAAIARKDP